MKASDDDVEEGRPGASSLDRGDAGAFDQRPYLFKSIYSDRSSHSLEFIAIT